MSKLPVSLLKYLALLVVVCIVTSNLLVRIPGAGTLLVLLSIFGAIYIALSVQEFLQALEKSHMPYDRFSYLPLSVVSVKVIKLGAFGLAGTILLISGVAVKYLGMLLLIILLADLLVFILRLTKKVYYLSLSADHVLFAFEQETKVFASQLESVEYRYNIFYLQAKNNKTYPIELARLPKAEREGFKDKLVLWVVCNQVKFTPEAQKKLADLISQAVK